MDVRHAPERAAVRGGAATWIAAAQIAVIYAGSTLLTPLYRLYRGAFGFSQLELTLIYAAYVLGNLTALLLLGRVSDQIGRRLVNLAAVAIGASATVIYLLATSPAWLFAGRILSGLGIGLGASATTAWLAELVPDKRRATVVTTAANFIGLAVGAILAGLLAAYLPWPLRLSYVVYLGALCGVGFLVARAPETVRAPVRSAATLSLRPRLGVPRELFGAFAAPATIGFAAFAVIGYYAALIPTLMAQALDQKSAAAGGAVVGLLCLVGAVTGVAARAVSSRTAMLGGSALLLPGLALLPCAEALHSLTLLVCGTVVAGSATMLGYRGSLQVVNEIAPSERRAELIASYILFMYVGNSVPIIGIGVLSSFTSSLTADLTFALIIAALAVLALITGARYVPRPGTADSWASR
jgi:MFS family permease